MNYLQNSPVSITISFCYLKQYHVLLRKLYPFQNIYTIGCIVPRSFFLVLLSSVHAFETHSTVRFIFIRLSFVCDKFTSFINEVNCSNAIVSQFSNKAVYMGYKGCLYKKKRLPPPWFGL